MTKRTLWFAALLVMTAGGCASTTPHWDAGFGHAVNAAKARQTLNPDASKNPDPVAGIDGAAAKESIDRYQSSFKEPPPSFEIFFGSAGAAR